MDEGRIYRIELKTRYLLLLAANPEQHPVGQPCLLRNTIAQIDEEYLMSQEWEDEHEYRNGIAEDYDTGVFSFVIDGFRSAEEVEREAYPPAIDRKFNQATDNSRLYS